jgi:hypothetical protein
MAPLKVPSICILLVTMIPVPLEFRAKPKLGGAMGTPSYGKARRKVSWIFIPQTSCPRLQGLFQEIAKSGTVMFLRHYIRTRYYGTAQRTA